MSLVSNSCVRDPSSYGPRSLVNERGLVLARAKIHNRLHIADPFPVLRKRLKVVLLQYQFVRPLIYGIHPMHVRFGLVSEIYFFFGGC